MKLFIAEYVSGPEDRVTGVGLTEDEAFETIKKWFALYRSRFKDDDIRSMITMSEVETGVTYEEDFEGIKRPVEFPQPRKDSILR